MQGPIRVEGKEREILPEPGLPISKAAVAVAVATVTASDPADVYCLTVPDLGCFSVAGGLIISNSYDGAIYQLLDRPLRPRNDKPDYDVDSAQARLEDSHDSESYRDPYTGY